MTIEVENVFQATITVSPGTHPGMIDLVQAARKFAAIGATDAELDALVIHKSYDAAVDRDRYFIQCRISNPTGLK